MSVLALLRALCATVCASLLLLPGLSPAQGAATPTTTAARPAQPFPIEDYVAPAKYAYTQLSPDGQFLAVLAPSKGRRNLVLISLAERKATALTGFTDFDVVDFDFAGSDFLVYSLGRLDTPTGVEIGDGGGLFAVRRDGTGFRKLMPTNGEQMLNKRSGYLKFMHFMMAVPGSPDEVLVSTNLRTDGASDVYRMSLNTGARKLLTDKHPGRVLRWVLDQQGLPLVAEVKEPGSDEKSVDVGTRVLRRDTVDSEWQEIARFAKGDPARWTPLAFAENNRDLIVSSSAGRDTSALVVFDVSKRQMGETLVSHPRYDLGVDALGDRAARLLLDPRNLKPLGLALNDDRHQVVYFNEDQARLQAAMEKTFPDRMVSIDRSGGSRTLVTTWSDRHVPMLYLHDADKNSLEPLFATRDRVTPDHLVTMRPFLLKTRDGLEIPSYYFLPATYQPGQRLPTVVHVHGGPHVRADTWGPLQTFGVREAQILASRGYAVVLPNFRITPGLGRKIYQAGKGELGRKMSEDHEDAALWAVQQGFADQGRMCISGASYGGYAALWAAVKTPELFKCAVAGLVFSDLEQLLTSGLGDIGGSKANIAYWRELAGQTGDGWAQTQAISPAREAGKIKSALMIYAGREDQRTPIEQTERMLSALKAVGKKPEVVLIKNDEGHGFGKVANQVELYTRMLEFLDRQIGPGSQM